MRSLLFTFLPAICVPLLAQTPAGSSYVLQDVRLIDGTGHAPVNHSTIVIRNGKIASITAGKTGAASNHTLNLSGKTVMPGLINAHGHLGLVSGTGVSSSNYNGVNIMRQLVQYESYGVTTMVSLGLNKDYVYTIRAEQGKGNEPGATLLTAGRGIGVPNGMPPMKLGKDQLYRPAIAEEARAAVRETAAHSPNLIKIWVDDNHGKLPKMRPEIYTAVIDEAHRADLKVAAHVYYLEDARKLIAAGVDILAHSVRDKDIDADTLSQMKSKGIYYIPTLQLEESFYIFGENPAFMNSPFFRKAVGEKLASFLEDQSKDKTAAIHRKAFQIAMQNVKAVNGATAFIGMGTDSGANPYRIPGWAEHRELQLMVEAGMTPLEAIHSATEVNAEMLSIADLRGTVEKGKQADLLVLDADPTEDIHNTEKIRMVFHNGRLVKPDKN